MTDRLAIYIGRLPEHSQRIIREIVEEEKREAVRVASEKPQSGNKPTGKQVDTCSEIADKLIEWRYQLRIEHNHYDMKWYAYYAGRDQRKLHDNDLDWECSGNTPLEAVTALNDLVSKHPEWRYERF